MSQSVFSPAGKFLHRGAVFIIVELQVPEKLILKFARLILLPAQQGFNESVVFLTGERAVEVIRVTFVIAVFAVNPAEIEAVGSHDGGDGVEKAELAGAHDLLQFRRQSVRREGAAAKDAHAFRKPGHLFVHHFDLGMCPHQGIHFLGKEFSVHCQGVSGGNGAAFRDGQKL
ncbi:MAG: hypothetical protein BWX83_01319 [Candidatus Cloacimonetes bacterium ADurb.Bin117]|nr:MAG: hypothetical protein BWX83_01319 [Candidatus Cloacimonetes bacterium ADurb.Bin117]